MWRTWSIKTQAIGEWKGWWSEIVATDDLDVKSTEKGFLPPRMTQQEKLDIVNPAIGLVVYDTEVESLFLFNGTDWEPLATGSGSRWEALGGNIFGRPKSGSSLFSDGAEF